MAAAPPNAVEFKHDLLGGKGKQWTVNNEQWTANDYWLLITDNCMNLPIPLTRIVAVRSSSAPFATSGC